MKIPEIIKNRRSVRAFSSRDLPGGATEMLVEAACLAPSAGNLQPWEFVIVRDEEIKRKLAEAAHDQSFIAEAPVAFVVCAVPSRSASRYGKRGYELYCLQDTAAAVENLLLTATENGLGGCWVGAFDEVKAAEVVKAPEGARPIAIVPVGYPAESPQPRSRRRVPDVVHIDKW